MLLIKEMTELETVRAMFMWVICQEYPALQEREWPDNVKEGTVMYYFKEICSTEKLTHAQLFNRLSEEAGIPCMVITGITKGPTWFPDYTFQEENDPNRHEWNAVFIDGHWRFIDAKSALPISLYDKDKFTKGTYEEFYFLPDPDKLINFHYPDHKDHQLLPIPKLVDREDYEERPKVWPVYFANAMTLPKKLKGLMEMGETGIQEIKIEVPMEARKTESYKCELLTRKGMKKKVANVALTRSILHFSKDTTDIIQVYTPGKAEYILEIYSVSSTGASNVLRIVAIYQINSNMNPTFKMDPMPLFPKVCTFFGLNPVAYQLGITRGKPVDSVVKCDALGEGRLQLTFEAADEDAPVGDEKYEFVQNLYDAESLSDVPIADRVLQCVTRKGKHIIVNFLVRAPVEGNYALIIYVNAQKRTKPNFVALAHYLVSFRPPGKISNPFDGFPHIKQGKVGPVQPNFDLAECKLVGVFPPELNDVHNGWLLTDEFGEAMLCFEHDEPMSFLAEKVDNDVESLIECTPKYSFITIRSVPRENKKVFYYKIYAGKMGNTEKIPHVYTLFVIVNKPSKRSLPLPKCPSYYWGGVQNRLEENKVEIKGFTSSTSWTQNKFRIKPNKITNVFPCRLYGGDADLELELSYVLPIAIKPMLKLMDPTGATTDFDHFVISECSTMDECTIRARFPKKGVYVLALFSSAAGEDLNRQQLVPLYYALVLAEEESFVLTQYAATFALWSASCHTLKNVQQLEVGFFKKGEEVIYKLDLQNIVKSMSKGLKMFPFAEVILLIDDKKVLNSKPGPIGVYEWNFKVAPDTKNVSVAVIPKPGGEEVLFALQYKCTS